MQEPILKFIKLYESLALVKRDYLDKDKISPTVYKIVELVSSSRGKKFENRESLYLTKILMNKYNRYNPPNPSDLIHVLELIDRLRERRKIKGDLIADKSSPFNPDQPFPQLLNNLNKEFVIGKHVAENPNERIDFKSLGLREGKDYNLIYDRNNIQVLQLLTFESTKIIKDVTNWCIQYKRDWHRHEFYEISVHVIINYNFNVNDYRRYCALNIDKFGNILEFENSQQTLHTDPSKLLEMPDYSLGAEKAAEVYLRSLNIPTAIFKQRKVSKKSAYEKAITFIKILQEEDKVSLGLIDIGLTNDDLKRLTPEILKIRNLKILDLDANELTTLPKEIGMLKNLEYLSLKSNRLTAIPFELKNLKNLKTLLLDDNKLENFPLEVFEIETLQLIDISANKFSKEFKEKLKEIKNNLELAKRITIKF